MIRDQKEEKFPRLPLKVMTQSQKYGRVFTIENEEEAKAFFNMCVDYTIGMFGTTEKYATGLEKQNIAFYMSFMLQHGSSSIAETEKAFRIADMIGCKKELTDIWSV